MMEKEIEVARKAAKKAGKKIISRRDTGYSVEMKGDSAYDSVTEVDIESEQIILKFLRKNFPDDDFLTEETKNDEMIKGKDRRWVIDPIDGTGPYRFGLPIFGVSIGLLKNGKPILGVLNFPALDEEYYAAKGKGTFLNDKKISVNKETELDEVMIGMDWGWPGDREREVENFVKPLIDEVGHMPCFGCTIYALAMVARGNFGGYVHWAYPWDYVAGAAIIEEAGGKVTDYEGNQIDWLQDDMSVLASNGTLHNKLVSLIRK